MPPPGTISDWRWNLAMLGLAVGVVFVMYAQTLGTLAATWFQSATYNHCVLIAPISLYLLWRSRAWLVGAKIRFSLLGLAAVALAGSLWWFGAVLSVRVLEQFSFVAMLIALVYALLGADFFRRARFPLLFLLFAVPVGDFLIEPLMEMTATATVAGVSWSGVPVYREGMYFSTPSGNFEVAKACSGIRYLIATLATATLFVHYMVRSPGRKLLFMSVAFVVPIVANWMRAYGIVMLAHFSDMRLAAGVDHLIYGWLFFGVVISLVLLLGWRLREESPRLRRGQAMPHARSGRIIPFAVAGTTALALVPALAYGWLSQQSGAADVASSGLPRGDRGWIGPSASEASWRPHFPGADQRWLVDYVRTVDGARVTVFVARHRAWDESAELVGHQNRWYDEPWRATDLATAASDAALPWPATRNVIHAPGWRSLVVLSWYLVGGKPVRTEAAAKLHQGLQILRGRRPTDFAVAVASTGGPAGHSIIVDFLTEFGEALHRCVLVSNADCTHDLRPGGGAGAAAAPPGTE